MTILAIREILDTMKNSLEKLRKLAKQSLNMGEVDASMLFYSANVPARLGGRELNASDPRWHQKWQAFSVVKPYLVWFTSGGKVNRVELRGENDEVLEVFEVA